MIILVDKSKNTYVISIDDVKSIVNIDKEKIKKHKGKRELYKEISDFLGGKEDADTTD